MTSKQVLIVDNNDSFTQNLFHLVKECNKNINVVIEIIRTNNIKIDKLDTYEYFIVSPGSGLPNERPMLKKIINFCIENNKPLLGICLGHQAIVETLGGSLKNLESPFHGVKSKITKKNNNILFQNIPNVFFAGKYHSWVVEHDNFPIDLEITSVDEYGNIMSLSHKSKNILGVQFHPESIMTEFGNIIMQNFLNIVYR